MPVLLLDSVKDTNLWQRLNQAFSGADHEIANYLATNLTTICAEASDRMKAMPTLMPQFTLHDGVHGLRVTELMWRIMPQSVAEALNPIEIALLILSAFFHDQGMVMDAADLNRLNTDTEFQLFRENWAIDHPNVKAIRERMRDRGLDAEEMSRVRSAEHEMHGAMLTDFIRRTHGERSAEFLRTVYASDKRLTVSSAGLAEFVARLSLSHVRPAQFLSSANGFRHDEVIGMYTVNMVYLALVLRLADIMDFDRDRTPDSLYRTIDFRSGVSLQEWEKHRSVDGWKIASTQVQYTLRCTHPEYQRAAYQFMDWIDQELVEARRIVSAFPASAAHYGLELPLKVDRSRIEPKDATYVYRDLEFSLSRDEIVSLFMTKELYGDSWLCVRELLQNALDALRYRRALSKRDGADWHGGRVSFEHELDLKQAKK